VANFVLNSIQSTSNAMIDGLMENGTFGGLSMQDFLANGVWLGNGTNFDQQGVKNFLVSLVVGKMAVKAWSLTGDSPVIV
jgi:hypothetical protein